MARRVLTVAIAPRTLVLAIALLLALAFVAQFKTLLALVLIAILIASALSPVVGYLQRLRIPRPLGVLMVVIAAVGVLALLGLLVVPVVLDQAQTFASNLPTYSAMFQSWLDRIMVFQARFHVLPETSRLSSQVSTWLSQRITGWIQTGLAYTLGALNVAVNVFAVALMTLYLLIGGDQLQQGLLRLVPARHRPLIAAQFEPVAERLGAYVRGLMTSMSSLAILLSIGLSLIGLPYAWLIAIIAGILDVIPYMGSLTGIVIASLIALTVSWKLVLLVIGVFAVSNFIQGNILGPLIYSRAVDVPPILVLLALLIGSQLLGLLGAVLAVPVTAVLMLLVQNLYVPWADQQIEPAQLVRPPAAPPGP
ncbi:MAG TPA: AI-2E family transporter [Stenomitos sp.]